MKLHIELGGIKMGELINCGKCGRMFSSNNGQKFCDRCKNSDEDDFMIVREYIYDNPNSTAAEVAEGTGIDESKILKFLRQGKLQLKGEGVGYPCDKCGKSISTGKFCDQCSMELKNDLNKAFGIGSKPDAKAKEEDKKGIKMHIKR